MHSRTMRAPENGCFTWFAQIPIATQNQHSPAWFRQTILSYPFVFKCIFYLNLFAMAKRETRLTHVRKAQIACSFGAIGVASTTGIPPARGACAVSFSSEMESLEITNVCNLRRCSMLFAEKILQCSGIVLRRGRITSRRGKTTECR